ncbi:hypothetical protein QL285_005482 [Trifolium repens]|nr:hypothetical protein QL285_005482 [Trifolium repens]
MGLSSAIGAPFLLNGVCLLPCGGSPPISVGFSPYFAIHFSSLVPPPPPSTSITFSVQPTINSQAFLARIKFAMVFSSLNRTSTNSFQIYGHAKQPPPEPPPPLEKMQVLRYCVFNFAIVIVGFLFYCCYVCCVLFSSLIYVKFPLMVFDKKLQRCLAEMNYVGRKDLIVFAANQFLFSIQQVVSSHVVRLIDFENPDSRYVHPQAKEMIRNWIELKTVVPQPTYHVWKIFAWLLGFCYWFCSVLLISKSLKFIDVKILVSLVNCVVFSRGGGSGGTQGGHSPP